MIRKANRNISVAKGHGYTFEKVKYALDFVNGAGRNTTLEDWVNAYNYIKGTNENANGCHACKAAKFTAGVRNYAQYGYLTLLNEGYKAEDFKDKTAFTEDEQAENVEQPSLSNDNAEAEQPLTKDDETLLSALETLEKVQETTSPQTCNEEKQVVEQPKVKNKGGRPKKTKK